MEMKWESVDSPIKPKSYRLVLISYQPKEEGSAPVMSVGYYKDKGDYGYFISPGSPLGAKFVAWSDCLGDDFIPFEWKMSQIT